MSLRAVSVQETTLRPAPTGRPEPDFVAFWSTGSETIGNFACAACGRRVRSVRQLPECPSCGGLLWELESTSPFRDELAQAFPPELGAWHEEELARTAGLARGVVLGLVLAPLCWLVPLAIALSAYLLLN
ncbi:MAG TPA: hypothetical protein VLK24_10160 [Gaiellaceae bacterium]|nr:hypothetical protein [Gaiellaceae bacterium]